MRFTSLLDSVQWHITERADATAPIWHGDQLAYGDFGAMVHSVEATRHGLELTDGVPVAILGKKSSQVITTTGS